MEQSYLFSPAEVLQRFNVAEETGLSQEQVVKSRAEHGPNGVCMLFSSGILNLIVVVMLTARLPSSPRRSSNAAMGTGPGAIQRPAGSDLAGFSDGILYTGTI